MKIREVMTKDPVCCLPTDSAQQVAALLRDNNVGSIPVVQNRASRRLVGMITDRDLACFVVADGLDPNTTSIARFISTDVVSCRDGENLDSCERLMREHQVRRVPIIDGDGRCIGIVSQADLALKDKPEKVVATVKEISKPQKPGAVVAA